MGVAAAAAARGELNVNREGKKEKKNRTQKRLAGVGGARTWKRKNYNNNKTKNVSNLHDDCARSRLKFISTDLRAGN
jgi:hypothetical protein